MPADPIAELHERLKRPPSGAPAGALTGGGDDMEALWKRLQGPASPAKPEEQPSVWKQLTDAVWNPELGEAQKQGVMRGLRDPLEGGAQIGARMMAAGPEEGAGAFDDPQARAAMPGRVDQAAQQSEQAYQQNPAVMAQPVGAGVGRMAGNMLATAPTAAIPGGQATIAGRAAVGALSSGIGGAMQPSESDDYWQGKAKQVGLSLLTGLGLGAAMGAMAPKGTARGTPGQLASAGVPLTPGMQMGAGPRSFERSLEAFPILRGMIQRGEARSIDGFNKATAAQVLEPIGATVPRNLQAGHGLIEWTKDKLSEAYDRVKPNLSFAETEWENLMNDPKLMKDVSELGADHRDRLATILNNRVTERFKDGHLTGEAFKQAESELSDKAEEFGRGTNDAALGNALHRIIAEMRGSLVEQNGDYAKELQDINSSYAMFTRMRRAAAGKAAGGKFTPGDLMGASLNLDRSVGKGAYATGDALMQAFAEAANKTLGKVTSPGSTVPSRSLRNIVEMLAVGGAIGGLSRGTEGAGMGAAAAAAAPYAAKMGMSLGAAAGRAPGPVQTGVSGAAGAGVGAATGGDRTSDRLKASAKVGQLQTERYQANRRGDIAEVKRLGGEIAEAHKRYRSLGGAA
jgi:hypothetical protein